jgi:tRNA pseudouridine38-40 synthase
MARYFLELAYKGTNFAGFQVQQNADTVQGEVEKAFKVYLKTTVELTGSSRTDAGVHAFQNFFHFDHDNFDLDNKDRILYHLNAILQGDIVLQNIYLKGDDAHCRFDAVSRSYCYSLYAKKNPFIKELAFFYPYPLQLEILQQAAEIVKQQTNFKAFSKTNTQVNNFRCNILESYWKSEDDGRLSYYVTANRFLRGMVKALTGTMLNVGKGKMSVEQFENLFSESPKSRADFSPPSHGLTLLSVNY